MQTEIKVLAEYVLIRQTMTVKKSIIIRDVARKEEDKFDYHFEVLQLGDECKRGIQVGDFPIFAEHVRFQRAKILESTETRIIILVIVHEGDIIGIDNSSKIPSKVTEPSVIKMN